MCWIKSVERIMLRSLFKEPGWKIVISTHKSRKALNSRLCEATMNPNYLKAQLQIISPSQIERWYHVRTHHAMKSGLNSNTTYVGLSVQLLDQKWGEFGVIWVDRKQPQVRYLMETEQRLVANVARLEDGGPWSEVLGPGTDRVFELVEEKIILMRLDSNRAVWKVIEHLWDETLKNIRQDSETNCFYRKM